MIGGRVRTLPLDGGFDEVIPADELERPSEYGDAQCDAEVTLTADPWRVVLVGIVRQLFQPLRRNTYAQEVPNRYADLCKYSCMYCRTFVPRQYGTLC